MNEKIINIIKTVVAGWMSFVILFTITMAFAVPEIFTIENIIPILLIPSYLFVLPVCILLNLLSMQAELCNLLINANDITWVWIIRLITGVIASYINGLTAIGIYKRCRTGVEGLHEK